MKRLVFLLLVFVVVLSLASCAMLKGDKGDQGIPGRDGKDGKDGESPTISISADGYWVINGIKTWYKANGTDGKDGAPGKDGVDGITPTIEISADGYWIINGTKTDCKAEGTPGKDGEDGTDGNGGQDGVTPLIKFDGDQLWVSYDDGVNWEFLGNVNDPICQHRDADDDYLCDYCDDPYADGTDSSIDPDHSHSFGEWRFYGKNGERCNDALFYRTCSGCNVIEWRDGTESDHIYNTVTTYPTCISTGYDTKTCAKCGKSVICNETSKTAHTYSDTYSFDASYHWKQCTYCSKVKDNAEHIIDGNGFCIICMQPLGPTAGIGYDYSIDGTYAEVIGYNGTATQIVIADTYNGLPVKNIMTKAFYDNDNITSVLIPDSVITIGSEAFSSCSGLTSVVIGDSVTTIGSSAFNSCSRLTSVVIGDSVTTIGSHAFSSCSRLTSVVIPDSVTTIDDYAFSWCSGLTSVTIGNGVTSIGSGAFYSCNSALYTEYEYGKYVGDASNPSAVLIELTNKNFTTYTIHEDTEHIACGVFYECARLTNITIPNGVKSISAAAFSSCSNLTSVVIPDSVTTIGSSAFNNCSNLKTVYYKGTAEDWANISIGSNNSKLTSATRYYYSEAEPTESGRFWHYDENGDIAVW